MPATRLGQVVLSDLLGPVSARVLSPSEVEISDLAYDSRAVTPGTLFLCVPGHTTDGHDHAAAAVAAGACALVVERELAAGRDLRIERLPGLTERFYAMTAARQRRDERVDQLIRHLQAQLAAAERQRSSRLRQS